MALYGVQGITECLCRLPLLCSYIPAVAGTARLYPFCPRGNRGQGWRSGASQDMEVMGVLPSHPALGAGPFPEKGSIPNPPCPSSRSAHPSIPLLSQNLSSTPHPPSTTLWVFWIIQAVLYPGGLNGDWSECFSLPAPRAFTRWSVYPTSPPLAALLQAVPRPSETPS